MGIIRELSDHPVKLGLTIGLTCGALNYIGLEHIHESLKLDNAFALFGGYSSYLAAGLSRDYLFDRPKKNPNLESRIYNLILENPKLCALAGSVLGIVSYYSLVPETNKDLELSRTLITGGMAAGGILGELTPLALSTLRRLKGASNAGNLLTRLTDFTFENPYIFGLLAACYNLTSKIHDSNIEIVRSSDIISSSLVGILATYATAFAGGIFHTQSIRLNTAKLLRTYYKFRGDIENAFLQQKKIIDSSTSKETKVRELVRFGDMYFNNGDEQNAYNQYRLALRACTIKGDSINHAELLSGTFRQKKNRETGNEWHNLIINAMDGNAASVRVITSSLHIEDSKEEYMKGKALEVIGEFNRAKALKLSALEKLLKNGILKRLPGKTRNIVSVFEDDLFFRQEVIVKESSSREKLEREMALTEKVRNALKLHDKYSAPNPIGIINFDNNSLLFLEFEPGETLYSRLLKSQETLDLEAAMKSLLLIYSQLKVDMATEPERDTVDYLSKNLSTFESKLVSNLKKGVVALSEITGQVPKVLQKDAQPKNFLITNEGNIVVLDCEQAKPVPITHEITDLLDYLPVIDRRIRLELAKQFLKEYLSLTKEKYNEDLITSAYLSSRILRCLERYPLLIVEPELRPLAIHQIMDSELAVTDLKNYSPTYFNKYEVDLEFLRSGLKHLESTTRTLQA